MQINRLFNQQPPRPYIGRRATGSNSGVSGSASPVVPHAPPVVPPAPPVVPPAPPGVPPAPPVQRPQRRYPDVSIAELLASPSRLQMPLIHPEKENNGLWFKIDKCLTDDCTSIYTSDWRGAWHNFSMVSGEMKSTWWGDFVQKYYWDPIYNNMVHTAWKRTMMALISNFISKRKRSGKMPPFMSSQHWESLQIYWGTEEAKKKSKTSSENRCSDQGGLGKHVHTAGSTPFIKIKYDMMIANDGVEPSLPELVRITHTRKDGTFADGRSKKIVEEVESVATQQLVTGSVDGSTATAPSVQQLNKLFIEVVSPYKGRVYGLGSAHCYYGDSTSSTSTAIPRTMHLEMVEDTMKSMQGNMNSMATDVAAIMESSRRLLEANGIDPSVVLRSTTANNTEQTHVTSPHQSPTSGHQVPPTTVPSPINLGDMEPQSFDGYFETN